MPGTGPSRSQNAHALLIASPILWSANHLVARWAADWFPPHAMALSRWVIALVLMLAVSAGSLYRRRAALRTEWPDLLLLGALGMWVCGVSVYFAGRTTSATNIGLIYSASPVLVVVAGALLYQDRPTRGEINGTILAVLGVIAIIARGTPETLRSLSFTAGDFWVVLAAVAWAIYCVILRYRPTALDPFSRLSAIMAGGILLLAPFTVLEAQALGLPPLEGRTLVAALILGLAPGFGAYLAHSWLMREIGPARTGLITYLIPVYNALFGWLLLGEQPQWYHALGGALVLGGVYVASRRPAG